MRNIFLINQRKGSGSQNLLPPVCSNGKPSLAENIYFHAPYCMQCSTPLYFLSFLLPHFSPSIFFLFFFFFFFFFCFTYLFIFMADLSKEDYMHEERKRVYTYGKKTSKKRKTKKNKSKKKGNDLPAMLKHFTTSRTHSKISFPMFPPSTDSTDNRVCFGDLNRAVHQDRRGGGAACIQNTILAQTLSRIWFK